MKQKIEIKCKVGMVLTLGDKTLKCVGTEDSSYGLRYVFDNGMSFTENNIISNINLCIARGNKWGIA